MFDFYRRINRFTYLVGWIVAFLAWIPVTNISGMFYGSGGSDNPSPISLIILAVFLLVFFVYTLCLTKQRCNDISNDNAVLLGIVMYALGIALILLFLPGQKHANQYGPIPKKGIHLK